MQSSVVDTATINPAKHSPQRDPLYFFAVAVGPLFWLFLASMTRAVHGAEFWRQPQAILLFLLCYPILEEWLFRGKIQRIFAQLEWGRLCWAGISVANLITSMLFAALHLYNHSLLWAGLVFFPSLLFGLFRDRYGRIGPSILLHSFYNTGFYALWPPF